MRPVVKRLFTLILCVLFSQGLFPGNNGDQLLNNILISANITFKKGLYNDAGQLLNKFLGNAGLINNNGNKKLLNKGDVFSYRIAIAYLKLGICLIHLSETDSALRVLERGFSFLKSAGLHDEKLINQLRYQVGNCHVLLGNYNEAIKKFEEVLGTIHSEKSLKGQILENLGSLYFIKEDYENALLHFQKAFILKRSLKSNNPGQIEKLLVDIGATCCKMKDYKGAFTYYSRAEDLAKNSGNKKSLFQARLKNDLGTLYMRMNKPDLAMISFFTGLKLYGELEGESAEETALLLSNISNVYIQQGNYDSALYYLGLSFRLFPVSCLNRIRSHVQFYEMLGKFYEHRGMFEKALLCQDSAWNILDSFSHLLIKSNDQFLFKDDRLPESFRILENKGRLLYKLSLCQENRAELTRKSFNEYFMASRLIDLVDHEFAREGSRLLFNESSQNVFSGAFETGFQLYDSGNKEYMNKLFELVEASHCRLLLSSILKEEYLQASDTSGIFKNIIDSLQNEITDLLKKIHSHSRNDYPGKLNNLVDLETINDLYFRQDSLQKIIEQDLPVAYSFGTGDPSISLESVMERLNDNEAMVEYFATDSALFIMVLTKEDVILKKVNIPGNFREMVFNYYQSLKSAETDHFLDQSRKLYSILVQPVEQYLECKKKLLIIPPPELSLIPFETLARDNYMNNGYRHKEPVDWLLLHFDIRYHFSASLWYLGAGKENDDFTKDRFTGFAPLAGLDELPFSGEEVNRIAGFFHVKCMNATIFSGNSATKKILEDQVKKSGIIHIATHGIHDDKLTGCSGLIFNCGNNPLNGTESPYDVILSVELGAMKVKADLMVLSACGTGTGSIVPMEGVMSLPRECLCAGAKNIVYTLWNISDRNSNRFMQDFYHGILSGMDYSSALRDAKLSMLSKPETSLPFIWAPYVLLGR